MEYGVRHLIMTGIDYLHIARHFSQRGYSVLVVIAESKVAKLETRIAPHGYTTITWPFSELQQNCDIAIIHVGEDGIPPYALIDVILRHNPKLPIIIYTGGKPEQCIRHPTNTQVILCGEFHLTDMLSELLSYLDECSNRSEAATFEGVWRILSSERERELQEICATILSPLVVFHTDLQSLCKNNGSVLDFGDTAKEFYREIGDFIKNELPRLCNSFENKIGSELHSSMLWDDECAGPTCVLLRKYADGELSFAQMHDEISHMGLDKIMALQQNIEDLATELARGVSSIGQHERTGMIEATQLD